MTELRPPKVSSEPLHGATKVVLDWDVMRLILREVAMLNKSDLLRVMLASWMMRSLASEALLSRGVILESDWMTSSFCRFLAANDYLRAPYFRSSLYLDLPFLSPTTSAALCSALAQTTRLRKLVIHDADKLLGSSHEIIKALADLELDELEVVGQEPTDSVLSFLSTLGSHLSRVSVRFHSIPSPDKCEVPAEPYIPVALLERSAQNLRCICLENVSISGWADIVLPQVEHLEVTAVQLPSTDVLARALPSLYSLALQDVYWDADEPVDVSTAAARRSANHLLQKRYGSWSGLESVAGPVVEVFSLGLVCAVPFLFLESDRRSDVDAVMLQSLLEFNPELEHLELTTEEDLFALREPSDEDQMCDLAELDDKHWKEVVRTTQERLGDTYEEYRMLFGRTRSKIQHLVLQFRIPCFVRDCDPGVTECPVVVGLHDYNVSNDAEAFFSESAAVPTFQKVELVILHNDDPLFRYMCEPVKTAG